MKSNNNEFINFEKALSTALKRNGFIFPVTNKEVEEFEQGLGTTETEVPKEFHDPEFFLAKKSKEVKVIKLVTKAKPTKSSYSLKVASKKSAGKPKRKK